MATIGLNDASSPSVNVTVFDNSVLGKTPSSVIHFLRSDVIGALGQTLDQVQINSLSIGFDYEPSFSFEGGTVTFTVGGGPTGELDLLKPAAGGGSSPRHSSAVHRLTAWYREGKDVQLLLPQLSVYMGHAHLAATQVYLTMTPELLHEASLRFEVYAGREGHHD